MQHLSRMIKYVVIISVFFLNFQVTHSSAQQSAKAEDEIAGLMNSHRVVGFSVAVVKDDKVIYTQSFGYKELENRSPLTDNSLFRIASVSKSFTTTSLMQLIQDKKLNLEVDVSDIIGFRIRNPKFPDKKITLRMLLSHTSSINDSPGYFNLDDLNPGKNSDWEKCYNDYAPGSDYEYCNFNYNLAGVILEKVSGERFDHYISNHILKPLNIQGGFNVNDLDSSRFAHIYYWDADSAAFIYSPAAYAPRKKEIEDYQMGQSTFVFSPAGGLKISAPDLAKYMIMHIDKGVYRGTRIITSKSEKEMHKPLSDKEHYGLGLWTTTQLIEGETLIGHTGGAYGLSSAMFFEPKKKFGIVVISNGCDPQVTDGYVSVVKDVVNILYRNFISF